VVSVWCVRRARRARQLARVTVHDRPVPFTTYVAPAGVLCIGAAFVLRDWLQQLAGLWWALAAIPSQAARPT
jgi:hypothetical protein